MKALSLFEAIYIHRKFVDMRKSINGLSAIVAGDMGLDLRKSSLFIFCNKRRTHLKMLYFDRSGFALWLKRLEQNKFAWPRNLDKEVIEVSCKDLEMVLEGINIWTRFESVYFEEVI